jgi:hypothetical protein
VTSYAGVQYKSRKLRHKIGPAPRRLAYLFGFTDGGEQRKTGKTDSSRCSAELRPLTNCMPALRITEKDL